MRFAEQFWPSLKVGRKPPKKAVKAKKASIWAPFLVPTLRVDPVCVVSKRDASGQFRPIRTFHAWLPEYAKLEPGHPRYHLRTPVTDP